MGVQSRKCYVTWMKFVGTAAVSVWAMGDRDVAVRCVLFAIQSVGDTLAEYSRALIRLHQRIESAAPTDAKLQALAVLGNGALKHQYVVGVRNEWVRHELRRLMLRSADRPFIVVQGEARCLMYEEEARVVEMRQVEKAAPALSGPVGGSVSYVPSLDAVVLGDGRVSSDAVSGCLCDLDCVS